MACEAIKELRTKLDAEVISPAVYLRLKRSLQSKLSQTLGRSVALIGEAKLLAHGSRRSTAWLAQSVIDTARHASEFDRLKQAIVEDWVAAQLCLVHRFERDRNNLSGFGIRGRITNLEPGLSDPYHHGQTVTRLTFQNASRIIYKPRPCASEQRWYRLLQWMNDESFSVSFHFPRILSRRGYHWMEYLQASRPHASLFYFNWGAQLFLANCASLADLHRENWVLSHKQAVLIDAELFGENSWQLLGRKGRPQHWLDVSCLLAPAGALYPAGLGRLNKEQRSELRSGYNAAQAFVTQTSARQAAFIRAVVRLFHHQISRALLRSTGEYGRILAASADPHVLVTRSDRKSVLQQLCRGRQRGQMIKTEVAALLRWCIPRFEKRARLSQRHVSRCLSVRDGKGILAALY